MEKRSGKNVGPLATHTMDIRVTYRDTDQMGFVYYANYLVYFEQGRTELLRSLGHSYKECEEKGIFLPVLEANCQYQASARYDDLLEVETRVSKWTRVAMDFDYVVRRKTGGVELARGFTRHAFTSSEGKILRAGDKILDA